MKQRTLEQMTLINARSSRPTCSSLSPINAKRRGRLLEVFRYRLSIKVCHISISTLAALVLSSVTVVVFQVMLIDNQLTMTDHLFILCRPIRYVVCYQFRQLRSVVYITDSSSSQNTCFGLLSPVISVTHRYAALLTYCYGACRRRRRTQPL